MTPEIHAFCELLQKHATLLSSQDRLDLAELEQTLLSLPVDAIRENLAVWIKKHSHLRPTYLKIQNALWADNTRAAGGGINTQKLTPEQEKELKQDIIQVIRTTVSSPPTDTTANPTPPKTPRSST